MPFFKYFKSRLFSFAGGSPPCTPRRSTGGRPIGQEIMQNLYGWYETEPKSVVFWNLLFFEKKFLTSIVFWNWLFFKFVYFLNLLLWNAFFSKMCCFLNLLFFEIWCLFHLLLFFEICCFLKSKICCFSILLFLVICCYLGPPWFVAIK